MDWITELLSDPASLSVQDGAALLVVLIILVLGGFFGSSSRVWARLRDAVTGAGKGTDKSNKDDA